MAERRQGPYRTTTFKTGATSSSQGAKRGRSGNSFKNQFKKWKRNQENDGNVFISGKNYTHPGWYKLDSMTKAYNKLNKIMGIGVVGLRAEVEQMNREEYTRLNDMDALGDYSKMDKSEKKWFDSTRRKGGLGGDLNHNRLILEPRKHYNKKGIGTRAMWNKPNYQTAGFRSARVGLNPSKSISSKYRRKRVNNTSQGLRRYVNVTNNNMTNPQNPLQFKVLFDPGAIERFTNTVSKRVNILAGVRLGQWVRQAAAETSSFYVNIKSNTSKSKHYHKRVHISNDKRNLYVLIGNSIRARNLENKGQKGSDGVALNRYSRWVIGSFRDNSEFENGLEPTGVYAQGMSTTGPSLTEIRAKGQPPFTVKTKGAIPFGEGTKSYRRSGKEGQVFRKLKGR